MDSPNGQTHARLHAAWRTPVCVLPDARFAVDTDRSHQLGPADVQTPRGQRLRSETVALAVSGPEPLTSARWPGFPPHPPWSCSGPAGSHSSRSAERRACGASSVQTREGAALRPDSEEPNLTPAGEGSEVPRHRRGGTARRAAVGGRPGRRPHLGPPVGPSPERAALRTVLRASPAAWFGKK